MSRINRIFIYVGILFLIGSCISNRRITYMQNLPSRVPVATLGDLVLSNVEEYLLQYNDIVEINIKTTDEILNLMFDINANANQIRGMGGGMNMMGGGDIFYLTGFVLNDEGVVELPVIGKVKMVGMTTEQAKGVIENELKKYVRDNEFFVRVRMGGIRYSAIGEFNQPGKYTILQNRVTIFEAIANAGDLNVMAKRDDIMLIRQYPDGSRAHRINLNHKDIMHSEFYFIKPNDMIYAEPMKIRELGTGVNLFQSFQLLVSFATIGLLIYSTSN